MIRAAVITLSLTTPGHAEDVPLNPQVLLDQLAGQTVRFEDAITGKLVGVERFLNRSKTRWRRANGNCALGTVTTDDTQICFYYDDAPDRAHCWFPFSNGDNIGYRSVDNGERQFIRPDPDASAECVMDLMF